MNNHPTVLTIIKQAEVDEKIVPLIDWLNRFNSVHTLYCCQGGEVVAEDEDNWIDKPYVLWTCTDALDLVKILYHLGFYSKTYISWHSEKMHIEYCTRFQETESVESLVDWLNDLDSGTKNH